jgi:hypothetical protein
LKSMRKKRSKRKPPKSKNILQSGLWASNRNAHGSLLVISQTQSDLLNHFFQLLSDWKLVSPLIQRQNVDNIHQGSWT